MTDLLLRQTGIPTQFRDTLFDDYDTTRRGARASVKRKIDEWDPTDSHPALLLQGPPGVGKTMLASALLNEYHLGCQKYPDTFPDDAVLALHQDKLPVYFVQLAEWIDMQIKSFKMHDMVMRDLMPARDYLDLDKLLEDLNYRVKVLVIDDVGKEHRTASGFALDAFDLLVRRRHNEGLVTIYTTNIPLKRWSGEYSESMQSIIGRSSLVLDF